ncbi:hypothetical protein ND486_11590 [Pseudonocardia sp. DR1-2]|uniref:hypothetical protein n=1 Tax=Pseudonocardia sp. DR1-2 TaxID=2951168 RepID=UPI0020443E8C|nr:hypothetical protein [Pseudonocardia sp. DR1-2]MCM3846832.1 hypothetical protein [Pseudonocardia sp. DR1-2]
MSDTVTLRVTSPCEHGVDHEILELIDGAAFSFPECKDSKGKPRIHIASKEAYPETKRRR